LQGRGVARSQDQQLASKMASDLFVERTLKWDADVERKVAALTVAQVNAAVRRHIRLDAVTIVKAGDFARAKEN
jgi:zinc protease